MSERSISRALLRLGAVTTAAILVFGTANAAAQPDGPTLPTETTTSPPTTTEPPVETTTPPSTPPSTSDPAPTQTPPTRPTTPEPPKKQPEPKQEPKKQDVADLRVTATLDKASYESHEQVRATVTITNKSAVAAQRVHHVFNSGLLVDWAQWGDLSQNRPGITLAPGATHTVTVTGTINEIRDGKVDFWGSIRSDDGDADLQDNYFSAKADVTATRGAAGGFVYADANLNGKPDTGEAVSGAVVTVYGGSPSGSHQATTGSDGRWALPDIAAGSYTAWYELPGGWIVRHDGQAHGFDVAPSKPVDVTARAERPLAEYLTARVELDTDTYLPGYTAQITVVLQNRSSHPVPGVKAGCNRIGEGNHLNVDLGAGVDLAPHETRSVTVTDVVPDVARTYGWVEVTCDFEPDPAYNADGPEASDRGTVPGGFGGFSGTFAQDKNNNRTVDAGEGIGSVELILLDWNTRRWVTSTRTGADGRFTFEKLPAGVYDTRIVGPWKFTEGNAGYVRIVDGDTSRDVTHFAVPAPTGPNVEVTASFDKATYDIRDQAKITVTVANTGTAMGTAVFEPEYTDNSFFYDLYQWKGLRPNGGGMILFPGQSVTVELTGALGMATEGKTQLKGRIKVKEGDVDESDNAFHVTAAVTHRTGTAAVTVYGDRNENGKLDDGEALKDTTVAVEGGVPHRWIERTTDAAGRADFTGIATGSYRLTTRAPDGWFQPDALEFEVKDGATAEVQVRTIRPQSDKLPVSMRFDKPSYRAGERVGLTVTMTNSDDQPIPVRAHCAGYGWAYEIANGPEWGDFRWDGPGAVLAAGETRSFHVEQDMPKASPDHGLVLAECAFGSEPGGPHSTFVRATTKVPGATWTTSGRVLTGNGHDDVPVGNVPLVLLDPDTGKVAARTNVDAQGNFTFPDLPVGHYTPLVVGPWKVVPYKEGPLFEAVRGSDVAQIVKVVPGPEVEDPGHPEQPGTPSPPGGGDGGKKDALAKTGASVLGLTLVGLLLVAFGFGASAASRRRAV